MNPRIQHVITDLTGVTGLAIIDRNQTLLGDYLLRMNAKLGPQAAYMV